MKEATIKVICIKCKHHYVDPHGNPAAPNVWYNHKCIHPSLRRKFNYVLGIEESAGTYCRDINPKGECKLYEAR